MTKSSGKEELDIEPEHSQHMGSLSLNKTPRIAALEVRIPSAYTVRSSLHSVLPMELQCAGDTA